MSLASQGGEIFHPLVVAKPLAARLILLPTAGDDAGQIRCTAGIQDALGQGKPGCHGRLISFGG